MFFNAQIGVYFGEMAAGDRPATAAEVAAWETSRAQSNVTIKIDAIKALREVAINRINGIADREQRAGNTTIRAVGDAVVIALLAMTKNLPANPAQVEAEVVKRYLAIRGPLATTAPELESAFADMDQ